MTCLDENQVLALVSGTLSGEELTRAQQHDQVRAVLGGGDLAQVRLLDLDSVCWSLRSGARRGFAPSLRAL